MKAERRARSRRGNGSAGATAGHDVRIASRPLEAGEALPLPRDRTALRRQLEGLAQELADSCKRCDQLQASLEKRTHRVQQLIGERDRLIALLAERDAEIRKLDRELGALTARSAPVADRSPGILAAARAMLGKIRPGSGAPVLSRPTPTPSASEPAPVAPGLVPWRNNRPPKAVLCAVIYGLPEREIASVVDIVERDCAGQDLAPLLLTDHDAFQLFRGRRVLFEFLPPRSEQERHLPELDWRFYTLRRLALIRRKWQPVRVVAFGRPATEIVRLWLDSPFETRPIPALLKGQADGHEPGWCAVRRPEAVHP